jgi:hypothetical protein
MHVPRGAPIENGNSVLDLKAEGRLKVVVPWLKAGQEPATLSTAQAKDGSLMLSAENLIGYQSSYYSIVGGRDGRVRLRLQSAETTKDGVKTELAKTPELPLPLPTGSSTSVWSILSGKADQITTGRSSRQKSCHG